MHASDVGDDRGGDPRRTIRTHRRCEVDASSADVWAALQHVEHYRRWWPWLRSFDGDALAAGERWSCRIALPLPWSLWLTVHLLAVEPGRIEALVGGDVSGPATIAITPAGAGAVITLDAALRASGGATRAVHRVLPALSRWGHDRVIDRGFAQFAERVR